MKLLNFGLFDKKEPQRSLRDSLKNICDHYTEFSFVNNIRTARRDFNTLMRRKPDVVFMQIQTPGIITSEMLKQYKGVKFFNFSGDVRPGMPEWYFDVAPYVTTLFTNTDWVEVIQARGHGAEYFQIGFDHNIYKPTGFKTITKPVVFMGNNHGYQFPLSKLRGEMVERFSSEDWFQVYGRGWKNGIDLNYKQQQEAAVYRSAKIGINLSHMDLGSYTSDRMFRLMGSGCMCLAYKHKDIEKEFIDSKHLICWSTIDELEFLIKTMLTDIAQMQRSQIAISGCDYVHQNYTWPARMKQLTKLINE